MVPTELSLSLSDSSSTVVSIRYHPPPHQSRKPYINSVRLCFAHPMNHTIVVTNSHMVFLAPRFIKSCQGFEERCQLCIRNRKISFTFIRHLHGSWTSHLQCVLGVAGNQLQLIGTPSECSYCSSSSHLIHFIQLIILCETYLNFKLNGFICYYEKNILT